MPDGTRTRRPRSRKPVEYPTENDRADLDPPLEDDEAPAPIVEPMVHDVKKLEAALNTPALRSSMPSDAAGTFALATMSDDEFRERLNTLKRGRDRIAQIQRELMELDVDYGLIPGTPKPTLFKPGAEKLALIYGLAARLENEFVPGDGEKQPLLKYESACFLHLGSFDGPIVAVGHGTANGWEKRYRRDSDKACPNCGKTAIIKSKYEPGWYCFPKKGGCGSKFAPDDPGIEEQVTDARGDPVAANDLQNTLLKMSEKRAFVDAVLRATASSSLFTQDVAEEPVDNSDEPTGGARRVVDTSSGVSGYDESTHGPSAETGYEKHDPAGAQGGQAEEPEPEVRSADLGEVQRGGHRPEVTGAQIESARTLARSMKLNPWQVSLEIREALGPDSEAGLAEIDTIDDKPAAAAWLLGYMQGMDPDDMGKVITHLRAKAAEQ